MIQLNFPNAVTDAKDFYDRQNELDQIEAALFSVQPKPVLILGERCIGKTSLINVCLQRFERAFSGRLVRLFFDGRNIRTVDSFMKSILTEVALALKIDLSTAGWLAHEQGFRLDTPEEFEQTLHQLAGEQEALKFLLVIDEMEGIYDQASKAEYHRIDALLQSFVNGRFPLLFLGAMTNTLRLMQDSFASPLHTLAEIVQLRPFSEQQTWEMVDDLVGAQMRFDEAGLRWIFHLSGGHPYFVKLLLAVGLENMTQDSPPQPLTPELREKILTWAVRDARPDFTLHNVYKAHMTEYERRVLLLVASLSQPVPAALLRSAGMPYLTAARELVRRDYLAECGDDFDFKICYLREWLLNLIEYEEELDRLGVQELLSAKRVDAFDHLR
jgi:hypothetical protein